MTPALRQALVAADALLRQRQATAARAGLEQFAVAHPADADTPEFDVLYAESAYQSGDADIARRHALRALAARADWFEAHHLLGRASSDLGLLDDAVTHLERAVELRPRHARAVANLASVRRGLGQTDAAVVAYRAAIDLDPANANGWRGLAETLQASGDHDAAIEAWTHWTGLAVDNGDAPSTMGLAYIRARRWDDAERTLLQGTSVPGADHRTDVLLGFVRRERGDTSGALAAYQRGAERFPDALTPAVAAALVLPQVYQSGADAAAWRASFELGLQQLETIWPRFEAGPATVWDLDWTNFYLAYQGENDLALQTAYADLVARLTARAAPEWSSCPPLPPVGERTRIRVGFASSHFRRCTVAAYFGPWITQLDRDRFEVHAFHFGSEVDDTTALLRASVDRFVHVRGGIQRIAERIREARLDVLVYPEVGMDGRDVTLSTLRLAPVQCAAWGHPVTTGSAAIDCFFSCDSMEPDARDDHYRERLLLLPGLGTRYRAPVVRHATRAEFGLPDDVPLYVWPQSLFKIHPDNDAVFCAVLLADPRGWIVFCADPGQRVTLDFRARIERALRQSMIDPSRVAWQPLRREDEFRAMLSVCDVMVDTLHWSGGNTSLDAIAAGLPIATVRGHYLRGRQSAAMLDILGLDELVARDVPDLVATAGRVALDNGGFRKRIAERRGRLFDRDEPIRSLERHLQQIAAGGIDRLR